MKTVLKALLAASMLMPVAVQAQEQDGRGPGRRGDWGERAPRGDRGGPARGDWSRAQPPRSADLGVEAQARAERPQPRFEAPAAESRGPGGWQGRREWQRDDRADREPARPDWRQQQQQQERQQRQRWGAQQPRGDWRGDGRSDARAQQEQRMRGDWQQQRQQQARGDWRGNDRRDWNDDRRRTADRGWNDNRGWNGNDRGWNDRRGGNWNRGWRNDDRYDWNRYRQLNRGAYNLPRYYAPSGWGYGYRRFSVGVSLSSILWSRNYWIDDPYAYRLPEAWGPYRWVRYYDDALLVDIRSGQVVDVVYDIFY